MRVASKLIVLVPDGDGASAALSAGLHPNPNSNLTRSNPSPFEVSLGNYGVKDLKATGDLVHFVDPHGSPQVSMLLLPNYEPPVAACAIREILALIVSDRVSDLPTMVIPCAASILKHSIETKNCTPSEEGSIYGVEIGGTSDFSQAMIVGTPEPPSALQIYCEPLACLLRMVRVLKLPTVLLVASSGKHQTKGSSDHELETLYAMGEYLASRTGLCFSKDNIQWKPVQQSRLTTEEPWRALYG